MALLSFKHLALFFGVVGNVVSFLVFLAPVPTFYKIYKRKSSEGYQSIPYVVALLSSEMLFYYAFIKSNAYLIVSINGIGCVIEIIYISIYLIYATKKDKMFTIWILVLNIGCFGTLVTLSWFLLEGLKRVAVVGWACAVINVAVFASPLSIMSQVIRTKSTEFMPLNLSIFLTLCATTWFFYGFFVKDKYIAFPNVLGFLFGIAQIILYCIYKDYNKDDVINDESCSEVEEAIEYKEGVEISVVINNKEDNYKTDKN